MTPWMHISEIKLIESYLTPDSVVMEWGSGGSTLHFSKLVKKYYSVEHQKGWYDKIKAQLPENVSYHYVPANNPEASRLTSSHEDYKDYIEIVDTFNEKFDVILIDGRARVACARYVKKYLKTGGVIIVHDFFKKNRQRYHVLMDEFNEVARIDNVKQGLIVLKDEPMISNERLLNHILLCIEQKKPLSVVRFGDGEYLVATDKHHVSYTKHLGYVPSPEIRQQIADNVIKAIKNCDIIGVTLNTGKEWDNSRDYFMKEKLTDVVCSSDFHNDFLFAGYWKKIIKKSDKLLYISGHNLTAGFRRANPKLSAIARINIPLQVKYWGVQKVPHFPIGYDATIKRIREMDLTGYTCLIGAGFVGKMYAIECAKQGGIAIDCGSVFDRWAGRITRGKLKNTDSDEYKL